MILILNEEEERSFYKMMNLLVHDKKIETVQSYNQSALCFCGIKIFSKQRKVEIKGIEVRFSRFEFDVLLFLAKHPRQVFTRKQIYEAVWDDIPVSVDAKVECMIYSIRKKLRAYTDRKYIRTVWGGDTNLIRKLKKEPSVRAAPSRFYTLDSSKEYRSSI